MPQKRYRGETFLLLFQNLHRYALYVAILFIVFLLHDAYLAFWRDGKFGIGVGTIVMCMNVVFLSCYTFGCHSFRHLVGGRKDKMSGSAAQSKVYDCVTCLNKRQSLRTM